MTSRSRIPQLAYPFALVGAAGGWLSAGFLANPIINLAAPGEQLHAAVCAGLVAAGVGAALTRWCVVQAPWLPGRATWARLVTAVLLGGFVSGAGVGAFSMGTPVAIGTGAANGLLSSIALVPVCALVLAAARRAERARLGSIVAGVDRRAVWGILAASLAVVTLAALPDWPAARAGVVATPLPALGMIAATFAATAAILGLDAAALFRVARAAGTPGLAAREAGELEGRDDAPRVDLGLGEEQAAVVEKTKLAYRGRDRAVALLLGSVSDARAAILRALLRGVAGAAVIALCAGAHGIAHGPWGARHYEERECAHGHLAGCAQAAELIRAEDGERALSLYARACSGFDVRSCVAAAEMRELGRDVARDPAEARTFRQQACSAGSAAECGAVARDLRRAKADPGQVTSLFQRACAWGDASSCAELEVVPARRR